jgi:hypothetical protein
MMGITDWINAICIPAGMFQRIPVRRITLSGFQHPCRQRESHNKMFDAQKS